MASVIPSGAGRSIEQAGELILQAAIERARMRQQESQFGRTLDLQSQQLDLGERQLVARQQAQALERTNTLIPLNLGKRVAEVPAIARDMAIMYPEFDAADWQDPEGLGMMELGSEPFSAYLNDRRREWFDALPGEEQERYLERSMMREMTGITGPSEALDIQDIQYSIAVRMLQNPQVAGRFAENLLGRPERIDVTVGDKRFQWDSADEARIAIALMQLGMSGGDPTSAESIRTFAEDLQALAREKNVGITIPMAESIIRSLHAPLEEGETMQERVDTLDAQFADMPAARAALDMYVRGVSLMHPLMASIEENAPGVATFGALTGIMAAPLSEGGFGWSKEMIDERGPGIARRLAKNGFQMANPGFMWMPGWRYGEVTPPSEREQEGFTDEDEIVNTMEADIQALIDGTADRAALRQKYDAEGYRLLLLEVNKRRRER